MKRILVLALVVIVPFGLALLVMIHPTGLVIAAEPTPPAVIFTNPSVGARAVHTYTLVSATFNEDMNPSTINSSTFFVSQGAVHVAGSIGYIAVSKVAVFYPGMPLAPNTIYTATITTGVRNLSGEPLAKDVAWTFITSDGASPVGGGMHIYFGDLHNHSGYSDGQGHPSDAFATARANGLDFFALTDHSDQLTSVEWQDMLDWANAATVNGEFVGLRGFEFTHSSGHINVFDTGIYVSASNPDYDTFDEFYAWLAGQPTAVGQFNHPHKSEYYNWNFDDFAYHAAADQKMYLRETPGYPANQYLLSLNAGWHIGASGNSDTHGTDWGRRRYMGLVAPSLAQDAVLQALRARRTFSVDDRNFALVMQANGTWMGSVISNTPKINFTITAYDPDPTDLLIALVLYDNGVPVTATAPLSKPVLYTWTPSIVGSPGHYYYVKAYHDTDAWSVAAYTSPVWTDTSETIRRDMYLPTAIRDFDSPRLP